MNTNKMFESIIRVSISKVFDDNDIIRFMGEYVYAKNTLEKLWLNDLYVIEGALDKVVFTISRPKEARYFKNKKLIKTIPCYPSELHSTCC